MQQNIPQFIGFGPGNPPLSYQRRSIVNDHHSSSSQECELAGHGPVYIQVKEDWIGITYDLSSLMLQTHDFQPHLAILLYHLKDQRFTKMNILAILFATQIPIVT